MIKNVKKLFPAAPCVKNNICTYAQQSADNFKKRVKGVSDTDTTVFLIYFLY